MKDRCLFIKLISTVSEYSLNTNTAVQRSKRRLGKKKKEIKNLSRGEGRERDEKEIDLLFSRASNGAIAIRLSA